MASNEIEIDVTLDAKSALSGLDKLKKGAEDVGEGFASLSESVTELGGESGEALVGLGESVGGVVTSMKDVTAAATGAGASFTALLGPIGAVAVAVYGAYEAFIAFFGASEEAEAHAEALAESYKGAAADLTDFMRELAMAGQTLSVERVRELEQISRLSQAQSDQAKTLREESAERRARIELLGEEMRELDELMNQLSRTQASYSTLASLASEQSKLRVEASRLSREASLRDHEAAQLVVEGAKAAVQLEEAKREEFKKTAEFRQQIQDQETLLLEQAVIDRLAKLKGSAEAEIVTAVTASDRKVREVRKIEDIAERVKSEAVAAERVRLEAQIDEINERAEARRKAERARRLAIRRANAAKELALERLKQAELARIRMAEIEAIRLNGASALEVLQLQYEVQVTLAGDNQRKLTALELEFENKRTVIVQEEERKRQEAARIAAEEEQRRAQQRQAFLLSSLEFDARMLEDGLDKELQLLDLKYRREVELAEHTQEELTELQRRHEVERQAITERSVKTQIETLAQYTTTVSQGLAESTYNAILFGESFSKSIGEIMVALGKQAAGESLMETARGFAALLLNPALAANHFMAAGAFGTAAAVLGSGGAIMSGGGGGGGASAAARGASPSGAPQTAPAPERERAETSSMVFNINFGNSTIYDTKRAAQDAMASEIMRTMNRQRRGSPRFMGV
jgi:hypothetical protein